MAKQRQVSFVKEVYHSTDEDDASGSWCAVSTVNTDSIVEEEAEKAPETWEKMLSALESKCEIDSDQLQFKTKLRGACGSIREVWRAQLWHIDVVVKQINLRHEHSSSNLLSPTLAQEVSLLKSLRHPNCVLFIGYTNPPRFSVVTEYMSRGNIRDILNFKSSTHLSGLQFFSVAISVARGMNYLHTLCTPIVHGNLSSYNILCQDNWDIKIADYGMKLMMDPEDSEYGGRIPWRAPEVELGSFPDDPAADVYAYGIILWELVTSEVPHASWNDKKQLFRAVQRGLRPKIPASCSPEFKELMEACWDANPSKRPTFHEIIEKLVPYEKISVNHSSKQLFPNNSSITEFTSSINNTQKCTTLFTLRSKQTLSLSWTFYLDKAEKQKALRIIKRDISYSDYSSISNGELVLSDAQGKVTWITNFLGRENLQDYQAIQSRAESLHQISQYCVTPVVMEVRMLQKYSLKSQKPSHALVITVTVNNKFRRPCLDIFEDFVIPGLREDMSWCGTLLIEGSSGCITVVSLHTDEIRLDRMIRSGVIHSQINHFKRYLMDIPVITKETIERYTFFKVRNTDRTRCNSEELAKKGGTNEKRRSAPLQPKLEVKPKPSKPLQLEETDNPPSTRELLYHHPFSASNNIETSASCKEFGVIPKIDPLDSLSEGQVLGRWKVIVVEPVRGSMDKKKIKSYFVQRKMEPMVLLAVSLNKITYFPCGAWSQAQGATTVTQSRARTIPLDKVTKITQLTLPGEIILFVLEISPFKKWVIFGFENAAEFVTVLQNKTFPFSFVNHNVLSI